MSPEEKLEMGRKLIAEAEAEIAAKKRNWPEKIEELMVFKRPDVTPKFDVGAGHRFVVCLRGAEKRLLSIDDGSVRSSDSLFGNSGEEGFEYLGRLRDLLPRKTDNAHEPTGVELVEYELGPDDTIESTDEMYHPWFGERRSHNWRDSFPEGITVKLARAKCGGNIRFFRKAAR